MKWVVDALSTSVGKKFVMAITGLLLCGFLVVHLAGNLLLYVDGNGQTYSDYAKKLHSYGYLLVAAEIGLLVLFVLHLLLALKTAGENRAARKVRYQMQASKIKNQAALIRPDTWMFISGALILGFLILHLVDFKFEVRPDFDYSLVEKDPAEKAKAILKTWPTFVVYTIGCIALGLHLAHGVSSAFQSLGANHPKYESLIRWCGVIFAALIAAGFVSFPIIYFVFRSITP